MMLGIPESLSVLTCAARDVFLEINKVNYLKRNYLFNC